MTEPNIEAYAQGGEAMRRAVEGLSREQLLWRPPAEAGVGLWSVQQVVIHMMDSDLIWTARLKQIIAEDNPRCLGYNQERFAAGLFCDEQSAEDAATIFMLNRRNFARVLRNLTPEAWDRTGQHAERGEIRLGPCIDMMTWHAGRHIAFIDRKRAQQGW
jgi:uncharacterized damage-inducible protein DinB